MRDRFRLRATGIALILWLAAVQLALADGPSTGPNGINSQGLGLTGVGVKIGQVEPGRPGIPRLDNAANSNNTVVPVAAFIGSTRVSIANGNVNMRIDSHAEGVAGVMIATGVGAQPSVAPAASLYSGATDPAVVAASDVFQAAAARAQNIVNQGVLAINQSSGIGPVVPNAGSLYTQFVDWSTSAQKVLYVVAGDERGVPVGSPSDGFNRINIGFTRMVGGVFNQVDPANVFTTTTDGRTEIDLVAPGRNIMTADLNNKTQTASGTSFAAPLVTGTVALLQQLANTQFNGATLGDAQRPEVMKAVLMNSADKFIGALGMQKTITNSTGQTWLQTHPAGPGPGGTGAPFAGANFKTAPLDPQMGTGQLNAARAVAQLEPGEFHATTLTGKAVGLIGWDYGTAKGVGDNEEYVFNNAVPKDQWISITLAWDHVVNKDNSGGGTATSYAIGDKFTDGGQADLDLYLMPKGATALNQAIWSSVSTVYTVEHLFYEIQNAGNYEFWVRDAAGLAGPQSYGVAWMAADVPEPSTITLMLIGLGVAGCCTVRKRCRGSNRVAA